ncbi:MAG: haloacid dehalogenase type II [Burkholderiaceae bacterium]|nr:haloacid dehalogenase type II [Microbacteriaceae bacterium]
MTDAPLVIVFDVNETLSDMSPLAAWFEEVGAARLLAATWFAGVLRDGFALTAAGSSAPFADIASESLREQLRGVDLARPLSEAVEHIMDGFAGLALHSDVAEAVRRLRASGFRLVTLSNGSTGVAQRLLSTADIGDEFEMLLSVEDAAGWKPLRAAYEYAATACSVDAGDMLLVAVHPWDIDGASRAGLRTAWINRGGDAYPGYFRAPDLVLASIGELEAHLRRE